MAEANHEKPSDRKKSPEGIKPPESSDTQKGPEAIQKAKLEAKRERLVFMDKIEAENSLTKLFDTSKKNQGLSRISGEYPSFASTLGNRVSGDADKGAFEGIAQLPIVILRGLVDIGGDAIRFAAHPVKTTRDTLSALDDQYFV